jgi:hypothetical protein
MRRMFDFQEGILVMHLITVHNQPVVISWRRKSFKKNLVGGGRFQNVCEAQQCFAPLCPSHSWCKLGVGTGGFLVACWLHEASQSVVSLIFFKETEYQERKNCAFFITKIKRQVVEVLTPLWDKYLMQTPAFCITTSGSSISSHLGFRWLLNINDAGSSYNLYPMVTMDSTICFIFLLLHADHRALF